MIGSDCVDILLLLDSVPITSYISQTIRYRREMGEGAYFPSDAGVNLIDSRHGILERLRNLRLDSLIVLALYILDDLALVIPSTLTRCADDIADFYSLGVVAFRAVLFAGAGVGC